MDRARLIGCLLIEAIVVAPFLALLYDPAAGLAVMTVALAATCFLAGEAARMAVGAGQRRLIIAAVVNGALALGCGAALLAWLS